MSVLCKCLDHGFFLDQRALSSLLLFEDGVETLGGRASDDEPSKDPWTLTDYRPEDFSRLGVWTQRLIFS